MHIGVAAYVPATAPSTVLAPAAIAPAAVTLSFASANIVANASTVETPDSDLPVRQPPGRTQEYARADTWQNPRTARNVVQSRICISPRLIVDDGPRDLSPDAGEYFEEALEGVTGPNRLTGQRRVFSRAHFCRILSNLSPVELKYGFLES